MKPRCLRLTLAGGCPLPCRLPKGHEGGHEPRFDERMIAAWSVDLGVLALRDRGKSLAWIADKLGVTKERVRAREKRAMRKLNEATRELGR